MRDIHWITTALPEPPRGVGQHGECVCDCVCVTVYVFVDVVEV